MSFFLLKLSVSEHFVRFVITLMVWAWQVSASPVTSVTVTPGHAAYLPQTFVVIDADYIGAEFAMLPVHKAKHIAHAQYKNDCSSSFNILVCGGF